MMEREKRGVDIVERVIRDVNNAVKLFKKSSYTLNPDKFEKLLLKIDTSVKKKKRELIKELYNTIIKTFSVDTKKINKGKLLESLKNNLKIIRKLTKKLNDINYYLSTTFLEEISLIKKEKAPEKSRVTTIRPINKEELEKLEETVYRLIEKIIILDSRLLERFRKRGEKIIEKKSVETEDLEAVLKKQEEILYHLEAKLPPENKINEDLIKRPHFDHWASTVLALLTALKKEYNKETDIFKKLKKNQKLKKRIDVKIKHLMKEKSDALKLKEGRILMSEKIERMDMDWEKHSHNWLAVADL